MGQRIFVFIIGGATRSEVKICWAVLSLKMIIGYHLIIGYQLVQSLGSLLMPL
jgi:hypothetical protein